MRTEEELIEMYDDMLDECYGPVKLMGMEYAASYSLKELDPTAYDCGFNDFVDSLEEDDE